MSLAKKIMLAIGLVIIAIQFIQPTHNRSSQVLPGDISKKVPISDAVQKVLKTACYDCHSNNTDYPWYSYLQPVGWLIAKHISHGKEELNLSEFGSYSPRRQLSKMTGIANSIKDNIMPLSSYKLVHKNARLTSEEKVLIFNWIRQSIDSLSVEK